MVGLLFAGSVEPCPSHMDQNRYSERATVNIDRVHVKGLFGDFDHDLAFSAGERIMIVTGPNGFGKTTTLKLIDVLFNQSLGRLISMPFRTIEVSFDEGTRLIATRDPASHDNDGNQPSLTLTRQPNGESETFHPTISVDSKDLTIPLRAIEDFIPVLRRIGPRKWQDRDTGSILDLAEVLTVFGDDFPPDFRHDALPMPEWLEQIRESVAVRSIDTERLTRSGRRWRPGRPVNATRTVSHYSQQLAGRIQDAIAKYGALSQSLDRTFPARLVADRTHSRVSVTALREDLDAIERKRSRLEDVGLLAGEQPGLAGLAIPDLSHVDEARRGVLTVYAQDAKDKLAVFDELYDKMSTFKRIANSRFCYKQVAVIPEGLRVTRSDGTTLNLEKLSSGEQHELVMLYELLFRASSNSLILIDEPELSLHVAWQEQWVKDLEETAKLSDFRAIIATHSPEIIGDRWPLTVELHGPKH